MKNGKKISAENKDNNKNLNNNFITTICHELRTPLNAIMGFIDILSKTNLTQEQKELITNIQLSSKNLLFFINNMTFLYRLSHKELDIIEDEFILDKFLYTSIKIVNILKNDKANIYMDLTGLKKELILISDVDKLNIIFINLFILSLKYLERGDIILKVNIEKKYDSGITLLFKIIDESNKPIQLKNRINDILLKNEDLINISENEEIEILIAKKMTEILNGEFYYQWDKGNIFSIKLNFKLKEEREYNKFDKKILFVSSQEKERYLVKNYFSIFGCEVITSNDFTELSGNFDIVIIDEILAKKNISLIENYPFKDRLILLADDNEDSEIKRLFSLYVVRPITFFNIEELLINVFQNKEEKNKTLKVLVAEDNNFNIKLIKRILFDLKIKPDIVMNGKDAVEKVKKESYDLILMDIKMPVMDGIEATKSIRKFNKDVTIWAVTAFSDMEIKSLRDKNLFDDYIKKPYQIDEMKTKILKKRDGFDVKIKEKKEDKESDTSKKNFVEELIDDIKKVYGDIDKSTINLIISQIKSEIELLVNTLENSIKEKNYKEIERYAHSIKGITRGYTINILKNISEKARDIEFSIKEKNINSIKWEDIKNKFSNLKDNIKNFLHIMKDI